MPRPRVAVPDPLPDARHGAGVRDCRRNRHGAGSPRPPRRSISGGTPGTTIHHVWFNGDTQVGDVELHVDGSPWRTWSRKTIPADWTGAWHVEVRDAAGTVLKRIDFTVGS